jgi:hypothetical protein
MTIVAVIADDFGIVAADFENTGSVIDLTQDDYLVVVARNLLVGYYALIANHQVWASIHTYGLDAVVAHPSHLCHDGMRHQNVVSHGRSYSVSNKEENHDVVACCHYTVYPDHVSYFHARDFLVEGIVYPSDHDRFRQQQMKVWTLDLYSESVWEKADLTEVACSHEPDTGNALSMPVKVFLVRSAEVEGYATFVVVMEIF